jgi:hypothetical protein
MSHCKMYGVPMMDNADGRMLETGQIRGNSAPTCRDRFGDASGAEGCLLKPAARHGSPVALRRKD